MKNKIAIKALTQDFLDEIERREFDSGRLVESLGVARSTLSSWRAEPWVRHSRTPTRRNFLWIAALGVGSKELWPVLSATLRYMRDNGEKGSVTAAWARSGITAGEGRLSPAFKGAFEPGPKNAGLYGILYESLVAALVGRKYAGNCFTNVRPRVFLNEQEYRILSIDPRWETELILTRVDRALRKAGPSRLPSGGIPALYLNRAVRGATEAYT